MDSDVLIHVCGLQKIDDEDHQEPVEIVVPGQRYFRNGNHYLRYEEIMDDTLQPTINYVKLSHQRIEVRKKGLVNVHMVFERGKRNEMNYNTPFGTLQMGITATELELTESPEKIHMKVNYILDMEHVHAADCCLTIQALAKKTDK